MRMAMEKAALKMMLFLLFVVSNLMSYVMLLCMLYTYT